MIEYVIIGGIVVAVGYKCVKKLVGETLEEENKRLERENREGMKKLLAMMERNKTREKRKRKSLPSEDDLSEEENEARGMPSSAVMDMEDLEAEEDE